MLFSPVSKSSVYSYNRESIKHHHRKRMKTQHSAITYQLFRYVIMISNSLALWSISSEILRKLLGIIVLQTDILLEGVPDAVLLIASEVELSNKGSEEKLMPQASWYGIHPQRDRMPSDPLVFIKNPFGKLIHDCSLTHSMLNRMNHRLYSLCQRP